MWLKEMCASAKLNKSSDGWLTLCVNFTGCPDICLNLILRMSVRVFVDDMSTSFSRWSKTDCPVSCGQSPMQSADNMEAALLISRR